MSDVVTTLCRRAPYVGVIIYPVPVQGAGAGALDRRHAEASSRRGEPRWRRVVLLVRGGGSIEDLWAFNEEVVARAIVACAIPVVVGVGHESDITIADFAADLRAPTPTAAAELVAPAGAALRLNIQATCRPIAAPARAARAGGWRKELDYAQRALAKPLHADTGARQSSQIHCNCVSQAAATPLAHRAPCAVAALRERLLGCARRASCGAAAANGSQHWRRTLARRWNQYSIAIDFARRTTACDRSASRCSHAATRLCLAPMAMRSPTRLSCAIGEELRYCLLAVGSRRSRSCS